MNSLIELNNYNINLSLPFTDERLPNVYFDRLTPTNQTITTDKGFNFLAPVGIEITDIANASLSIPSYSIDLFGLVGASVSWPTLPAGVTSSEPSTRVYTVSGLSSLGDWDTLKSPTIVLPANYVGVFTYTSTISYYSAETGNQTVSWTTTATVVNIDFFTSTSDFIYTDGTTESVTGVTNITNVDAAYPSATWTVVATPNLSASIVNWTTTGTGGTFSVNGTTKVITISGTRVEVNARLNGLRITTNTNAVDFILTYAMTNSQNANTDSKVQIFKSYDLTLLGSVTGMSYVEDSKNVAITGYPVITDADRDGSGTYTLTITPNPVNAVEFIRCDVDSLVDTFNSTTKVLTLYGTRSEINNKLANLYIWYGEDFTSNFTLSYFVNNPVDEQKTKNQLFQCTTTDSEITNISNARTYLSNQTNYIFSSNTPYISDLDISGTNTDYYDPAADNYTITLYTTLGQWTYYKVDPDQVKIKVNHAALSSAFGLSMTHNNYIPAVPAGPGIPAVPAISTPADRIKTATVAMVLTSALVFRSSIETEIITNLSISGSKEYINGIFPLIKFYPTIFTSSNGTIVYTQTKNSNLQASQSINLTYAGPGSIATRIVDFTSSKSWTPSREEGVYGKITDLLVVGGGGGGSLGGGGGGQVRESTNIVLSNQTYSIVIGDGGTKNMLSTGNAGTGGSSSAFGITSFGGQGAQGGAGGGSYTWGGIFNAGGAGPASAYNGPTNGLGGGGAGSGDFASVLYTGAPPYWPPMEGGTITYEDYFRYTGSLNSTTFPGPGISARASTGSGRNAQASSGGLGAVLQGYFGFGYVYVLNERMVSGWSITQGTKSNSAGGTYTDVPAQTLSGSGSGARFTVVRQAGSTGDWNANVDLYLTAGGTGYAVGNVIRLPYNLIGESNSNTGSIVITITAVYSTPIPPGPGLYNTYNTGYGYGGAGGRTFFTSAPSGGNGGYRIGDTQYGAGILYNSQNNSYTSYDTFPITTSIAGGGGGGGSILLPGSSQNGIRGIVRIRIGAR